MKDRSGINQELLEEISALKQRIKELEQSEPEKMASFEQLSAEIAHELKNPLSIILQGVAYVQSSVEDVILIDACNRIKKSVERTDTIIQNLLSFLRQTPPSFSEGDINILIEEALAMVEHQMNLQNIQVIRDYAHFIPKVRVDSNQIKQVFINMFANAAEAMKDGGTITITTRTGLDKDGEPYVGIVLTDTGTGIIPEGTGLGLSVTKGIIDRHQGSIAINSEEETGTTVTITLPCNPSEKGDALNG